MNIIQKIILFFYNQYFQVSKKTHELKSISIEITNGCNLSCRHCYMNSMIINEEVISCEEWCDFFKKVKKDFGTDVGLGISGGEPLIRKDIFKILKYAKELGFNVGLATNGLLIDKENIKELKKYVSAISISLDGFQKSHNYLRGSEVYQKTLDSIKLVKEAKISLLVKTTVYKKNLPSIESFYSFVKSLGVYEWHFFAMEPFGRGNKNRQDVLSVEGYKKLCSFVDRLKNDNKQGVNIRFGEEINLFSEIKTCDYYKVKKCNAGVNMCSILYNGDIVKCFTGDENRLKVEGNILNDDFDKVWEEKFNESRKKCYNYCNSHYYINKMKNEK